MPAEAGAAAGLAALLTTPSGQGPGEGLSPAATGDFRFHIDEVSAAQIGGWITKPAQPAHRCVVALREGGQVLARTVASRFRADLAAAGIGDGCHSFVLPAPPALRDGAEHLIEIVEQETGFALTARPIRWRSGPIADSDGRAGTARVLGLARQADPADNGAVHAWSGNRTVGAPETPAQAARGRGAVPAHTSTRLMFDISDLVYYIGEHANLTGIQRVQSSIVLAILRNRLFPEAALTFLSFDAVMRRWVAIPAGFLATLLEDLFLPERQRLVSFPAEEARRGLLPGARAFNGAGVLDNGAASVLCLLGAAWVHQDYLHRVLALKRQFGTRFVMAVHDLIPIYARDTCDQDTARVFEEFMRRALPHADHLLSVSENTAADLRRYTQALHIRTPPITVTRNGSSFAEFMPPAEADGDLGTAKIPERFVLFVATIEGRKNHELMLRIWQRMIADGDDPPHLVCVGRLGWKSSGFIAALVDTDYLEGRIHLLRDISDTDLAMLYARCLFTVCPSLYEGWGLPVGESLAMGKICISSNRASIPEVAGEFGVYIDIDDSDASLAAIRDMIADAATRKRLEARIRRGYKPVAWNSVAEKVVEACRAAAQAEWREPYPYTAVPYGSEISFGRLDRNIDGTGEALLARIADARKGLLLPEPLKEIDFRRGEEIRSAGSWAGPEEWGCWACHRGGELSLVLPDHESVFYDVVLRLRASGPIAERPVRITANGERVWEGSLGARPRNLALRVRRRPPRAAAGWRLCLRVEADLTPELRSQIAALDARMPTIGFERLIVVPEDDVKTRLSVLYALLL